MPKLAKKIPKLFAKNAAIDTLGQIGSLRAGTPNVSKDPTVLQALPNFEDGWPSIVIGNNAPAIEDMNALFFVVFYFIKSIYENGLPELDLDETYYVNSVLTYEGAPLLGLRDDFSPTPVGSFGPLNPTDFQSLGCAVQVATDEFSNPGRSKDIILCNANALGVDTLELRLPNTDTVPMGKKYIIKNVSTKGSAKKVKVTGNAGQLIDDVTEVTLSAAIINESITIVSGGTQWYIV